MRLHTIRRSEGDHDDLLSALENNTINISLSDIEGIVVEVPGINDEFDWHWIIKLLDGRFGYLFGRCDYTGWD